MIVFGMNNSVLNSITTSPETDIPSPVPSGTQLFKQRHGRPGAFAAKFEKSWICFRENLDVA